MLLSLANLKAPRASTHRLTLVNPDSILVATLILLFNYCETQGLLRIFFVRMFIVLCFLLFTGSYFYAN